MDDKKARKDYTDARKAYGDSIRAQKTKHWFEWISNMDKGSSDIWKAADFVSGTPFDGCRTRVPSLMIKKEDGSVHQASSNDEKAVAFKEAFFPPPKPDDDSLSASTQLEFPSSSVGSVFDSDDANYRPAWKFSLPTDAQIQQSFQRLAPGKATCPGTPTNDILRRSANIISPYIGPLYRCRQWKVF
jgi:hypothetical protein